jgi:two-component system CheB/CheR fusion protein
LTLARTFTELHGGAIRAENLEDGGCRITVTLPTVTSGAPDREAATQPRPIAPTRQRVLLVDDNVDACDMLQTALSEAGHTVSVAHSGEEALEIVAAVDPEVAIVDVGLPGMSGYDVARRLRVACPAARLIALTGYGQPGDVAAALGAGFHQHCAKPITIAALTAAMAPESTL